MDAPIDDTRPMRQSDHDLLVQLHVQVENIRTDVRDLKEGLAGKVANLQVEKLDKKDFQVAFGDHESRLRVVERYGAIAVGVLYILGFISKFLHF